MLYLFGFVLTIFKPFLLQKALDTMENKIFQKHVHLAQKENKRNVQFQWNRTFSINYILQEGLSVEGQPPASPSEEV